MSVDVKAALTIWLAEYADITPAHAAKQPPASPRYLLLPLKSRSLHRPDLLTKEMPFRPGLVRQSVLGRHRWMVAGHVEDSGNVAATPAGVGASHHRPGTVVIGVWRRSPDRRR